MKSPKILWRPSEEYLNNSNMVRFMAAVNERYNLSLSDYDQLWEWSVANIEEFWGLFWDFVKIINSEPYEKVVDDATRMPGAKWFEGARLNFAQNLLRYRDDRTALIFQGEGQPRTTLSYRKLYEEVSRMAQALKAAGINVAQNLEGLTVREAVNRFKSGDIASAQAPNMAGR